MMVNKAAEGIMCDFCSTYRPGEAVLPAEHNKKAGGRYRPHCNKKICVDAARGRERPERGRRERGATAAAPAAATAPAAAPPPVLPPMQSASLPG